MLKDAAAFIRIIRSLPGTIVPGRRGDTITITVRAPRRIIEDPDFQATALELKPEIVALLSAPS